MMNTMGKRPIVFIKPEKLLVITQRRCVASAVIFSFQMSASLFALMDLTTL